MQHPHRPNPVQSISQQRQRFQLGSVQGPQQGPEVAIQEQVRDLAMEIYARLVVRYSESSYTLVPEQAQLRQLARQAQTAATAYFQSLGVQFDNDGGSDNGES